MISASIGWSDDERSEVHLISHFSELITTLVKWPECAYLNALISLVVACTIKCSTVKNSMVVLNQKEEINI